ncbi:deoxyguanosinetriphosphate triphosphohydrolase [bacterium TMED181]|nr:deoxyguanosinetriphosphate triphosphohydrolase [Planctomycetota bacterium]OUW45065.1 MAG: deoxyguanosinetriphosphate triphosphohydrolase [bacterium TMED181]
MNEENLPKSSGRIRSEEIENQMLAPFAMRSCNSMGRQHPEGADEFRTIYQHDRDRVVHCTAFRRLEYKTQVFANHQGDHYRTRLTHTLEVAQVSRAVARRLGLNEDLVETIALVHDVGHPPFGHAGERELAQLMSAHGGFNHNRHALRVVDLLESRYPEFPGLNLSWEVRESIVKHYGRFDEPELEKFLPGKPPTLEAQLADIGDSLAYDSHDLDDGLRSGVLQLQELAEIDLFRKSMERVKDRYGAGISSRALVARCVSGVISEQVNDLVQTSREQLKKQGINDEASVRDYDGNLIGFSTAMAADKAQLQGFLQEKLYRDPFCVRVSQKGRRMVAALFDEFVREPAQLPAEHLARCGEIGRERAVCDYIAGMTDRYCAREYERLFIPDSSDPGRMS